MGQARSGLADRKTRQLVGIAVVHVAVVGFVGSDHCCVLKSNGYLRTVRRRAPRSPMARQRGNDDTITYL
jgi:hypothetical protein